MNIEEAIRFAKLSYLAYEQDYSKVVQELPKFNLNPLAQICDMATDTEGFIAMDWQDKYIVVGFAGSESWRDAIIDANLFGDEIIEGKECEAHGGFVKCLNNVYSNIESVLKPYIRKIPIYITGHSLGGALASLLAYRLGKRFPGEHEQLKLYVYGCPPVGDKHFPEYFSTMQSHVVTCTDDIVSYGWLVRMLPYYKPQTEFLIKGGDHLLDTYIELLGKLLK